MRNTKLMTALVLGFALLAGARQADAHSSCKTRSHCGWLFKKYAANADTGCYPLLIPLCAHHSGSCGTASTSCSNACPIGNAAASASNSSSGCFLSTSHTGLGFAAALTSDTVLRDDDQGGGRIVSTADFDARGKGVAISLVDGQISSLAGGMAQRIEVYVFRDDTPEGVENDDPVRTRENTLWQGYVELRDGAVTASGFDPKAFVVATDRNGLSVASFANVRTGLSFNVSDADFDRLVVEVTSTETNQATGK